MNGARPTNWLTAMRPGAPAPRRSPSSPIESLYGPGEFALVSGIAQERTLTVLANSNLYLLRAALRRYMTFDRKAWVRSC